MSGAIHQFISTALAAAIVAGCAEQPQPVADPEATFRSQLGRQWELARLGTQEIPLPSPGTPADSPGRDLVPGRRPTITFAADDPPSFGGRSFCNSYGGPFTVRGDSLAMGQIMSSAVGCDGPDSLETRFFRGLRETTRFELDSSSLVLVTGDGTRMVFVPAATGTAPTGSVPAGPAPATR